MADIFCSERRIIIVLESIDKARHAARLADDKKAENIVALDLHNVCSFTDAFVICTGSTRLQLRAIADGIVEGLRGMGCGKPSMDGERNATWLVLDYGDVVIHIMSPDARDYYQLENLWGDGQEIDWQSAETAAPNSNASKTH